MSHGRLLISITKITDHQIFVSNSSSVQLKLPRNRFLAAMRLYARDYQILTEEENEARRISDEKCKVMPHWISDYYDVPKAVTHFRTLFPNNYLDPSDLKEEYVKPAIVEFEELLKNPQLGERDILNFIRENRYYFIIGSLLKTQQYGFGHHAAYLFPEFQLGNNFAADYLIVGRGSGGHEFIFVELESPQKSTIKGGAFGYPFRKGTEQIDRWQHWLEENYVALRPTFEKNKNSRDPLPKEFQAFDASRIHYVVIAGRREHFSDFTYRQARTERNKGNRRFLHYDHLVEYGESMAGIVTY